MYGVLPVHIYLSHCQIDLRKIFFPLKVLMEDSMFITTVSEATHVFPGLGQYPVKSDSAVSQLQFSTV